MKILTFLGRFNNFYFIITTLALIWVVFIDVNNIPTQIGNAIELHKISEEKDYYEEQIKVLEKEQKEVLGDEKSIEKYAREKYYMKKPSEDVFVLIDEKGQAVEK